MLIRMKTGCSDEEVACVRRALSIAGAEVRRAGRSLVVVRGAARWMQTLSQLPGVEQVAELGTPYKLAARAVHPEGSIVRVGEVTIGAEEVVIAAGPCSVESRAQMRLAASHARDAGARLLRGGAFKPRTSPYAFQGLGEEGLRILAEEGARVGLPTVTEVMSPEDVPLVAAHADMLQVGARNVQNFRLLAALGAAGKPVLLKRGMSTTLEELVLAAEYVMAHGNAEVVLCERGIRTFEPATRNTLDLNAVPALRAMTHLPILVDPSHGTGRRELVTPLSRAAVAAGADGLIVEMHPDPAHALSDGAQSLTPSGLVELVRSLVGHAALLGRTLHVPSARLLVDPMLRAYRHRIDAIDDALLSLLEERAELSMSLGRIKRAVGDPLVVPEREAEVLHRVTESARGPLEARAIERVFSSIIDTMRDVQRRYVA